MRRIFYFLVLSSALILSGCVARTYELTRSRIDQDLTAGNRGYLLGKAPVTGKDEARKENRTVRVFEVELGKPYQPKQGAAAVAAQTANVAPASETSSVETGEGTTLPAAEVASGAGQQYTVGKNDTLQKISKKFYGTTKNWTKIYNANKNTLKGPDKVYPGQVLNIPDAGQIKPAAENLIEPKENLK